GRQLEVCEMPEEIGLALVAYRGCLRSLLGNFVYVGARGESLLARAGDDDCPDFGIAYHFDKGFVQLALERRTERIEHLGPVQGEDGDSALDGIHQNIFICHGIKLRKAGPAGYSSKVHHARAPVPCCADGRAYANAMRQGSTRYTCITV